MANSRTQKRRTRSYRGESKRTSGSGALIDTVRSTITDLTGKRGPQTRGGGIAARASGLVGGLLGSRGRRRR